MHTIIYIYIHTKAFLLCLVRLEKEIKKKEMEKWGNIN